MYLLWLWLTTVLVVNVRMDADLLHRLARQVMLNKLYVEERIRSDGQSGMKQVRIQDSGSRPYHAPTAIGSSVGVMHDHPNYINTLGMGEAVFVLNGHEFRSRHNDFKLFMASLSSKDYHATEPVPLPEVPPSVLEKKNVKDQVDEIQEYFRAFRDQTFDLRDYRPYFKPSLCYLEGAWTTNTDTLEESFDSDRHAIDAKDWLDLQEKVRYTSFSGHKDLLENFAYLPTTIVDVNDGGDIVLAQWNYRILCHPLKEDLPLNRLHLLDDLAPRMANKMSLKSHGDSRYARFEINPYNSSEWQDGKEKHGYLAYLMEQIPGKDNYQADLPETVAGLTTLKLKDPNDGGDEELNTGYYHSWFKVQKAGAMGRQSRHRGFSDNSIFMAQTTRPEVVAMSTESCSNGKNCDTISQRWTYAIPLEIIYSTPLLSWNPYDIEFKPDDHPEADTVKADGRNGSKKKPYNGAGKDTFARTPVEFFKSLDGKDPADTFNEAVYVLDKRGKTQYVAASGHRISMTINKVGQVRLRYSIVPFHYEGSPIWKELEALKDIVLKPTEHRKMFREQLEFQTGPTPPPSVEGEVRLIFIRKKGNHDHFIKLSESQANDLLGGKMVATETTEAEGHMHNVELTHRTGFGVNKFFFVDVCDGRRRCKGHGEKLEEDKT